METKTAQQHIQEVLDGMQLIVEQRPYHAFALLAILIEVLGKCLTDEDWQEGYSRSTFNNALTEFPSLQKYSKVNNLYNLLRCGMNHAFLPKEGIQLDAGYNDFTNNKIGCKELYHDIIVAWDSIITGTKKIDKDLSAIVTNIDGPTTGATIDMTSQPMP